MRKSRLLATIALTILLQVATLSSVASPRPSSPEPANLQNQTDQAQPGQLPGLRQPQIGPDERAEKEMEKARRKQRWQDIKRDSERLLEVATELKQYVDKSGENVMSLEVIKKAQEMEKLSKDLQKKMKGE